MMHGSNANLSNTLTNFHGLLPRNSHKRTEFSNFVRQVDPNWRPGKFMEPVQTKLFWSHSLHLQIEALFEGLRDTYDIPQPDTTVRLVLPVLQIVQIGFESLLFFHRFAYTKWPTPTDFQTIERARVGLLAVYAEMKWRMRPTMHFSTNEALDYAHIDGTQYTTLNEAPENQHQHLRAMGKNTMKHIPTPPTGKNPFMKIIDDQQVMRALRTIGHAPPTYQLTKINPPVPTPFSHDIPPPQHFPPNM